MMKILIVTRSLPFHQTGGMEVVAWDLAETFSAMGHQVKILTTFLDKKIVEQVAAEKKISIEVLDVPPGKYSSGWWVKTREFAENQCSDIDVVLGVSASANSMLGANAKKKCPIYVFQAHGTSWGEFVSKIRQKRIKSWVGSLRNLYWGLFKDWIYRRYDGVVAIGDLVDKQLKSAPSAWLMGTTPLRLISNGIPEKSFAFDQKKREATRHSLNIPLNAGVVLSLCRLHPQKGVMIGLEAFALALKDKPDLHYVVVGDGPQLEELKAKAHSLGISRNVHFVGRVERDSVTNWYSACDIFLFPTQRVEGLPINLLEALASGLPVIVSRGGADHNMPLEFIDKDDVQGFSHAILKRIDVLAKNRTNKLPINYSIANSGGKYIKFFCEIKSMKEASHE